MLTGTSLILSIDIINEHVMWQQGAALQQVAAIK
jgi:hypothetical protein